MLTGPVHGVMFSFHGSFGSRCRITGPGGAGWKGGWVLILVFPAFVRLAAFFRGQGKLLPYAFVAHFCAYAIGYPLAHTLPTSIALFFWFITIPHTKKKH